MTFDNLIKRKEHLNSNNLDAIFESVAVDLMSNYCFKKNNEKYFFTEIEFYFWSPEFKDDFIHDKKGTTSQCESNKIYHHYSGFDITFGKRFENYTERGGILLRGLKNNQFEFICGPLKCSNEIFSGVTLGENYSIRLTKEKSNPRIFKGPRYGLGQNGSLEWRSKKYRFITDISNTNQKASGKTKSDMEEVIYQTNSK